DRSGGVTAFCGATEIGQGSDDVLVACVAEVLGIDPHDIRAVTGDTDLTPVDLGSYSSRVTLMMGNAAIQAAERAREIIAGAVPRVWIAHDIGRALNPTLVRGQVEGSVYMALGEALMEEQEFRRLPPRLSHALVHKFPSMLEYKSPTSLDMPEVFTELVEHPDL